ncbi:hypothetical protein DFH05DRAFT_1478149 [Lentinula detonsa]|uniref:Uncharacterized protein n=1 Tax=Lentinula detonsa TaxID=2804962 RepID=A0A9W8P4Y2_9AGAR|nr:hypothetical protein DFH05DRAFT_1478149 [Lentinula detonsa]
MMMGGTIRDEGGPRCVCLFLMSLFFYWTLLVTSSLALLIHSFVPFRFIHSSLPSILFVPIFPRSVLFRSLIQCPVCRAPIPGWDGKGGGVVGLVVQVVVTA